MGWATVGQSALLPGSSSSCSSCYPKELAINRSAPVGRRLRRFREGEIKRSPPAHFGLGPNAPAMPVNDPLDGGQADAGSLEHFAVMQALKNVEELVRVTGVEADAVVANKIGTRVNLPTDLNPSRGLCARILQRVVKQVD